MGSNVKGDHIFNVPLRVYNHKHLPVGEPIEVLVKVNGESSLEKKMLTMGKNLAECGMGSVEECICALRKCNMDENASIQMLLDSQKQK